MPNDLTFEQLNTQLGQNAFTFSNNTITLDIVSITGDSYTGTTDSGVVEFLFKLLKLAYETQELINQGDPSPLLSLSSPFYGTVQNGNPPTIESSITLSGQMPLNIDSLSGTN